MEKLLQLLNEYEKVIGTDRVWGGAIDDGAFFCTRKSKKGNLIVQHSSEDEAILQIISKKFGFIQWLVENNKIKRKVKLVIKYFRCNYYGELRDEERYNEIESLLMLLAISDDPISFLVSILK